jgi:hypothetical protein
MQIRCLKSSDSLKNILRLASLLRELGFKVPQEPCVMLKGGVVVFFYVEDVVFCHRKGDEGKAQEAI